MDAHNCEAIDAAAEQARELAAAADQQRHREVGEAYERGRAEGWDEALDRARQRIRDARDLREVEQILIQLATDGPTGPRQHTQPLGDPRETS